MLQISQIRLAIGSDTALIKGKLIRLLHLKRDEEFSFRISKHSIDARKKQEICDVYTVFADLKDRKREKKLAEKLKNSGVIFCENVRYRFPAVNTTKERSRPVIIGFGPAGIFAAFMLAKNGFSPIVFERGDSIEERTDAVNSFWAGGKLDPESNVQFGEGGAGTFSDGKLSTGVRDPAGRNAEVIRIFLEAGAPPDIAYEQYPHIGTDRLRGVIRNLREEIIRYGGEIRFRSLIREILIRDGAVSGVSVEKTDSTGETYEFPAEHVILAPGHSARDTIRMLLRKQVPLVQKNFAVGLRVSHPQSMIDDRRYGAGIKEQHSLPASSYKLTYRAASGRGVYSFCMCPGGYIVNASSEEGRLAVNGMSDYARDSARANSAIVITVGEREFGSGDPLAGLLFQEQLEKMAYQMAGGDIPVERFRDYECGFKGGESFAPVKMSGEEGAKLCLKGRAAFAPLHELLPGGLTRDLIEGMHDFDRSYPGFTGEEAFLAGLESRTSSPVRVLRDAGCMSSVSGLYPCGEGAGYAGGIVSAAIDGLKVAEAVALCV